MNKPKRQCQNCQWFARMKSCDKETPLMRKSGKRSGLCETNDWMVTLDYSCDEFKANKYRRV
jgi:hypothetical protein